MLDVYFTRRRWLETCFVPLPWYIPEGVEDIAAVVEADFHNLGLAAGKAKTLGLQGMMPSPVPCELLKGGVIRHSNGRADRESFLVRPVRRFHG